MSLDTTYGLLTDDTRSNLYRIAQFATEGNVVVRLFFCRSGGAGCGLVRLPQNFGNAQHLIHPAAPDEERIAQTIQILNRFWRDLFFTFQSDGQPFGGTANGAAGV